jgi:hypothetical protein
MENWLNSLQWLGYGIDNRGTGVRFQEFTYTTVFATVSTLLWGSSSLWSNGTGFIFPGVKMLLHSCRVSRLTMCGAIPPPSYAFMACCLIKYKDSFIFCWSSAQQLKYLVDLMSHVIFTFSKSKNADVFFLSLFQTPTYWSELLGFRTLSSVRYSRN